MEYEKAVSIILLLLSSTLVLVTNIQGGTAQSGATASEWKIHIVDEKAAAGSVMAIDRDDIVHVAYTDFEGGDPRKPKYAMHASLNDSVWNIESTNIPGVVTDFKLDANDNPHLLVALYSLPPQGLTYGDAEGLGIISKIDSNWSTQILDAQGLSGSLALDSTGNPCVAYTRSEGNATSLNYAVWKGSQWNVQTVDSNVSDPWYSNVNLRLDSNNSAHIMYEDYPDIIYAEQDQATWRVQTLLQNSLLNHMTLDSSGSIDFLYDTNVTYNSFSPLNNSLIYSRWNGGSLTNLTVASNVYVPGIQFSSTAIGAGYASFALDSKNYPHVDYYNGSGGNNDGSLVYSRWTGESWETQTVDSEFATGSGPIAIDSQGNPHICYSGIHDTIYYFTAYLMYATGAASSPTLTPSTSPTIPELSYNTVILLMIFVTIGIFVFSKRGPRK